MCVHELFVCVCVCVRAILVLKRGSGARGCHAVLTQASCMLCVLVPHLLPLSDCRVQRTVGRVVMGLEVGGLASLVSRSGDSREL